MKTTSIALRKRLFKRQFIKQLFKISEPFYAVSTLMQNMVYLFCSGRIFCKKNPTDYQFHAPVLEGKHV